MDKHLRQTILFIRNKHSEAMHSVDLDYGDFKYEQGYIYAVDEILEILDEWFSDEIQITS